MTPQHTLAEWNACRSWLEPALQDDDEGDVINDLLLNRAQIWRGDRGAMITRLEMNPPRLHVWKGGGSLSELLDLMPGMIAWGRQQGAKWATIYGRSGWAKVLARFGFEDRDGELWKAL